MPLPPSVLLLQPLSAANAQGIAAIATCRIQERRCADCSISDSVTTSHLAHYARAPFRQQHQRTSVCTISVIPRPMACEQGFTSDRDAVHVRSGFTCDAALIASYGIRRVFDAALP